MLEFTHLAPEFAKLGAIVAGISPDDVESHCRFRDKYALGTMLLADPEHKAIGPYGVWGPKLLYGRAYEGLIRSSVVVGPDGRVAQAFKVSRIKGHAAKVLEAVKKLASG
jgi:peroxiredoxin Q/BCP